MPRMRLLLISYLFFVISFDQWFVKKSGIRFDLIGIKKGKSLSLWCEPKPTFAHEHRDTHKHNTAGNAGNKQMATRFFSTPPGIVPEPSRSVHVLEL